MFLAFNSVPADPICIYIANPQQRSLCRQSIMQSFSTAEDSKVITNDCDNDVNLTISLVS